ncbi:helix-turn-helix domain-containing protein [Saccharothrix obliqua]|uniref:helix-turn-helix domain-containing protein n=1 Tax=Saccharothrix obliqua TaxID=2861747 RepID=UPI001C5E752B|nr:helix-turn-helix domain-containing protein [Saccharothrix obliqua]MBW4720764.1 GAF domain-containing protein [Saccharothrix obliqua]
MHPDPRLLAGLHEAELTGSPSTGAREFIVESWRRSLAARVDPDHHQPPLVLAPDEVAEVRGAHPLAAMLPVLRETLVAIARDADQIMIVTDAEGHVLWCEGASAVRGRAERVHLTEGSRWSEDAIGTNAMGTALALGRPVTVHSAEHLVRAYHDWTCAASPVRDPDTGRTIGVVDLSGSLRTAHPTISALVATTARLVESQLQVRLALRDQRLREANRPHLAALRGEPGALLSPTGRVLASADLRARRVDVTADRVRLADGREALVEPLDEGYLLRVPRRSGRRPVLSLRFLGGLAGSLGGRALVLSLRHAELLTALALHPRGLTAEQLALHLYGERGNPATVRAELHRLRAQLGDVLLTRPYRLSADVQGDFLAVRAALRAGDVPAAAAAYQGELLPRSDAPVVRAEREELAAAVRRGVLDHDDADALWAFAGAVEDVEVLERLVRRLPRPDPRHALAETRLRRALA